MAVSIASSQQRHLPKTNPNAEQEHQEEHQKTYQKYSDLLQTLPRAKGWMTEHLVQYQGHWLTPCFALKGALLLKNHFKAKPSHIFLATCPKRGTTWLRALIFATMDRSLYNLSTHPLLTTGPHACFPFLDASICQNLPIHTNLELLSTSSRLFSTHFPFDLLPESMTASGCKFVYVCRDLKDVLVSKWLFMNKLRPKELPPLSLEEAFELFCEGVSRYGPSWDHVLGYWKISLESPNKVLFLKYEDLKREPLANLRRLAEFMGQPFTVEEEQEGVVEAIVRLCSFESLSGLEVNKSGVQRSELLDQGDDAAAGRSDGGEVGWLGSEFWCMCISGTVAGCEKIFLSSFHVMASRFLLFFMFKFLFH